MAADPFSQYNSSVKPIKWNSISESFYLEEVLLIKKKKIENSDKHTGMHNSILQEETNLFHTQGCSNAAFF